MKGYYKLDEIPKHCWHCKIECCQVRDEIHSSNYMTRPKYCPIISTKRLKKELSNEKKN